MLNFLSNAINNLMVVEYWLCPNCSQLNVHYGYFPKKCRRGGVEGSKNPSHLSFGHAGEQKCPFWHATACFLRLQKKTIYMLVTNISPTNGWNENFWKTCFRSPKFLGSLWSPMVAGALLFIMAPCPTLFQHPRPFQNNVISIMMLK